MAYNKETGMYEGYIYKIYNDVNDKIYIGQTIRTIKERWSQHKSAAKKHIDALAIHIAMNKYNINSFHIQLIEKHSFCTIELLCKELNNREVFYIEKYKSKAPNGYNISDGGSGVSGVNCREIMSCDPYTLEMIFYSSIDEASIHHNIPSSNIIVCCQNKKCSVGNKIFRYKEDGIKKDDIDLYFESHPIIVQYDLYGNKLNVFNSTSDAGEYIKEINNLSQSVSIILKNIMGCCRGDRQTAYGYVWRKMNDSFDKYPLRVDYPRNEEKNVNKLIDVYTIDGMLVGIFNNVKEAFEKLGLTGKQTNQALRCCGGYNTMAFGYIWRYHNDPFNKYSCAVINGSIRVNKYTQDGRFIDTYNNYKCAADSVATTNKKAISDCCKGKINSYRDFLWFHINDPNQPDKSKIIN